MESNFKLNVWTPAVTEAVGSYCTSMNVNVNGNSCDGDSESVVRLNFSIYSVHKQSNLSILIMMNRRYFTHSCENEMVRDKENHKQAYTLTDNFY